MKSVVTVLVVAAGAMMSGQQSALAADTIAFSVSTTGNPFYATMAQGARDEAKAQGFDIIVLDAQNRIDKQLSDVEDAVTKGIKGLLINGVDDTAGVAVATATKRKIPVITLQRQLPTGGAVAHIGTNNVKLGETMIEWYANHVKGREAKILILTGSPGAASSEDRIKGFTAALPKYPNIKLLAQQTGFYDRAKSLGVAENLLQRHPDAEAILALNDEMAIGALAAATSMKRKIAITGMDANQDAVKGVAAGEMLMTISLPAYNMGKMGVQYLAKVMKGEKVPEATVPDVQFVTAENAASLVKK